LYFRNLKKKIIYYSMEQIKCLIIGSGPAGYTAAIYASRAGLTPVLYTGLEQGGQLMQTTDVENYPGYPNGIMGPEMMEDFRKQAERMGTDIRYAIVTKVEQGKPYHTVHIEDGTVLQAATIIIATGAKAKWLGIPSEQRLNGYGVSACAVCDGFFYKNMDVAIVGAGDTACEEALYLSKLCTHVYMLIRSDKMRASKVMQQRVLDTKNITVFWNSETDEILGDKGVEGLRILNNKSNTTSEIAIKGFFVAIGHKPSSDLFKGWIDMDEQDYIITKPGTTLTNIDGIFAAGDVQDKNYRQAVTSAGSGCMAALDAERYLSHHGL
jgi:thioredoxin reductase (NADPH)